MYIFNDITTLGKKWFETNNICDILFFTWEYDAHVIYLKDRGIPSQKWAHTQVVVGARTTCYHDEFKIFLPAILTPQHHLLFTFYHVDILTKLEVPNPMSSYLML